MHEPAIHVGAGPAGAETRRPTSTPPHSFGRGLLQFVPTVLVLAGLGGLAYWGHETGWTFGTPAEKAEGKQEDWCEEHGVAKSICVECNEALLPRDKEFGWCKEHGVHNCLLEHPELAQLPTVPSIRPEDLARARRALDFAPRPENSKKCKVHRRRIQFNSQDAFEKSGIDVAPAWLGPITESVSAPGEIMYDQTQLARLSTRAPGTVWRVTKQVGEPVSRGEVMALVDAAEVGKAKAEFLQSLTQVRLRTTTYQNLRASGEGIPEQRVREAESAVQEASIRLLSSQQALVNLGLPVDADKLKMLSPTELAAHLQFLGLPDDIRKGLDPHTTTANLLPIRSPLDGVVISRDVVASEVVDTARVLFVVGNVRKMWLMLYLRQEDAGHVAAGQTAYFRPDGTTKDLEGRIAWVSTAVEDKTRTIKVRADLANPKGELRANTFGKGRIVLREEKDAVLVSSEAVQSDGGCHVVFVRDKNFLSAGAPKVFHVRTVRVGASDGTNTEIIAGVLPGEVIATRGSGSLRGELLKNDLGPG